MMKRVLLSMWAATMAVGCVSAEDAETVGDGESQRSAEFFSQRDPRWSGDRLGDCALTIGSDGCAIAATAMALTALGVDVDPGRLNQFLEENEGYEGGCILRWWVAADFDGPGGATWVHDGVLGSPEAIKAGLDQGKKVIAESQRFAPGQHFAYIAGYDGDGAEWDDFFYYDPWDTTLVVRRVGDGWVDGGASTRVFR